MIRLALQGMHNKKHATEAYEVLARMECPVRGIVGPIEFNSLTKMNWAEIDLLVMSGVLASKLIVESSKPIFINISPETLSSPCAFEKACELLGKISKAAKSRIVVEIPERSNLLGMDLENILIAIKATGCQVAIDDFGSFYAGMDRLENHSWDYCKICLSSLIDTPDLDWLINVKKRCEEKKTKVIFEKLESLKDLDLISIFPDLLIQGYAFSRPELVSCFEPVFGKIAYA